MTSPFQALHREPRSVRPPFTDHDPDRARRRGETFEQWRRRMHTDQLAALLDPLDGIELGTYDLRILGWLAGWDAPTIGAVASLFYRARHAAPAQCGDRQ